MMSAAIRLSKHDTILLSALAFTLQLDQDNAIHSVLVAALMGAIGSNWSAGSIFDVYHLAESLRREVSNWTPLLHQGTFCCC